MNADSNQPAGRSPVAMAVLSTAVAPKSNRRSASFDRGQMAPYANLGIVCVVRPNATTGLALAREPFPRSNVCHRPIRHVANDRLNPVTSRRPPSLRGRDMGVARNSIYDHLGQQAPGSNDRRRICRYRVLFHDALIGWPEGSSFIQLPARLLDLSLAGCMLELRRRPPGTARQPIWVRSLADPSEIWVEGVVRSVRKPIMMRCRSGSHFVTRFPTTHSKSWSTAAQTSKGRSPPKPRRTKRIITGSERALSPDCGQSCHCSGIFPVVSARSRHGRKSRGHFARQPGRRRPNNSYINLSISCSIRVPGATTRRGRPVFTARLAALKSLVIVKTRAMPSMSLTSSQVKPLVAGS